MSLYIRHRAGWVCVRCGSRKWEEMQCAHVVPKGRYPAGRYAEWNALCLCSRCHTAMTWSTIEWDEWCAGFFGVEGYQRIRDMVRVRSGPIDYKLEAFYYAQRLLHRPDLEMIRERFAKLIGKAVRLGVRL